MVKLYNEAGLPSLPSLDDMLHSLLLMEEGEHEWADGEAEERQDLRHFFFPVTRMNIYMNHAANGPLPRPVTGTLHEYIVDNSLYGNINHERWLEHERGAHRRLARMIHTRPEQIALTASTNDGLTTIAQGLSWQKGDIVVSAEAEFPSNVYPWLNLAEYGVRVHTVPLRDHRVPVEDVLASIGEQTRLVSLSLVEFSTGYRNDIATIARHCHQRGVLCGIDAMQALGALEVDVQALGVDYLVAACHKWLLGPQTSGILYLADSLLEQLRTPRRSWFSMREPFDFFNYQQPMKAGAARHEYNATNQLPRVGLDAALGLFECIDGGMQAVEARILGLTAHAIAGLERLGYPVVSPQEAHARSGLVCFQPHPNRPDCSVPQLVSELAARRIYIAARGTAARISPHFYNTIEEIDTLLNELEACAKAGAAPSA